MYLVALLIFGIIIFIFVLVALIYFLFFNRKMLIIFSDYNSSITYARKKKDVLFFNKNNHNVKIDENFIKQGRKYIYFAQKLNENTYLPYSPTTKEYKFDKSILNQIARSYEISANRFKIGIEPFLPFITIAMVALISVLGVSISMKYATDITPVEAEAISELSDSLRSCSQYVSTSQETNLELAQQLGINGDEEEENTPR